MPNARERADWPSERDSAALTSETADTASSGLHGDSGRLSGPVRERCRVCGSTAVETHPRLPVERCGNCKEHRPAAAVDAAREDLAAELARVTAERDQARACIAELEKWINGSPGSGSVSTAGVPRWDGCGTTHTYREGCEYGPGGRNVR